MTIENKASSLAIQQLLMELWQSVLHLDEKPEPDDNFFDLGGHSLLVVKMLGRFRKLLVDDLSFDISFSGPALYHEFAKVPTIRNLDNIFKGLKSVHEMEVAKQNHADVSESTDEFLL